MGQDGSMTEPTEALHASFYQHIKRFVSPVNQKPIALQQTEASNHDDFIQTVIHTQDSVIKLMKIISINLLAC